MALLIKTTGLDQYAPGGSARVKLLIIGGPGVGKTRFSSYFPRPIYADCEAGLASVADRAVPYVGVNNSQDMLDLLAYLKQECRLPADKRTYDTVVIDTLDAFQRKVKNEWMEINKKDQFQGWEAWGYLNAKLQLLMVRLLNLDMNVIVNVHYKDKTTKDDDTGRESHSFMLQLQGEMADTAYNDFDFVGWMGTYFEPVNGERVMKRGLTFKATPDKPMLKDRLDVTPKWMEVTFSEEDYLRLFEAVQSKIDSVEATKTVGEIPTISDEVPTAVTTPEGVGSGILPPQAPREVPLHQLDKPGLLKRARELGVSKTVEGSPIRANTTKSELLAALEAHQKNAPTTSAPAASPAPDAATGPSGPSGAAAAPSEPPAADPPTAPGAVANPDRVRSQPAAQHAARQGESGQQVAASGGGVATLERVAEGTVDTATGELVDANATAVTHDQAVNTVEKVLGGQVIPEAVTGAADTDLQSETQPQPQTQPATPPTPPAATATAPPDGQGPVCEVCSKPLAGEKADYVKLAYIKWRKRLCAEHYLAEKGNRPAPAAR
jgi:hypothetical protein